ncbi:hypothetical protein SDC9_209327 [bioreactor metagenome]|uniref:Uncharacterized protein n=1 Tax=bioreactor metagenome TaxID=1076179 RepID=A0A645JFZ4_9ZZZZ
MGDEDHRRPGFAGQLFQAVLQRHASEGVERPQRFVQQQHRRTVHQGADQRYALRHTAGEMLRIGVGEFAQPNAFQQRIDQRVLFAAAHGRPEGDVPAHREPGEEIGVLKDEADPRMDAIYDFPVDKDVPGSRVGQSGDDAQQRRFTAAGRPHQ